MRFDEIAPHALGDEAARFIEAWHGPGNDDALVQLIRMKGMTQHPRQLTLAKGTAVEMLNAADLDELVYANETQWNLYHSVGFLKAVPERGRRGGKSMIAAVPGVFLDLDANKDTAFASEDAIREFLDRFPVQPTILVGTGTGGIHAYWKTDHLLAPQDAERLGQMWWALAQTLAPEGTVVDRVFNCDRVMRLPGSVRWPKKMESPSLSRLLDVTYRTVTPTDLETASHEAWSRVVEARRQTRQTVTRSQLNSLDLAGDNEWTRMYIASQLPEVFNDTHTWEQILEPLGWTRVGTDYQGRVQWARPGGDGKSATTDWVESPHVMSLFSTSPETGLLHLKDADIPLTKYRVFVQLHWAGDEAAFVQAYMSQLESETRMNSNG